MSDYASKLQTDEWKQRKRQILERDGFLCTNCGNKGEMHVHHHWYVSGLQPWEYSDDQLVCICNRCHDVATRTQNELKQSLSLLGMREQAAVLMIVNDFVRRSKRPKNKPCIRSSDFRDSQYGTLCCLKFLDALERLDPYAFEMLYGVRFVKGSIELTWDIRCPDCYMELSERVWRQIETGEVKHFDTLGGETVISFDEAEFKNLF